MSGYVILATAVVLCDVVSRTTCSLAGPSETLNRITTLKSGGFVEILKQGLKRNNDDYKEAASVATKPAPTSSQDNKRFSGKSNANSFRRNNDQYYDMYDAASLSSVVTKTVQRLRQLSPGLNFLPIVHNQSIIQKFNQVKAVSSKKPFQNLIENVKEKYQPSATPQQVNKNKIEKFKHFIETNKDFIKQYMSSKTEVQTQKADLRQFVPREHKPYKQSNVVKYLDDKNDGKLPDPALLDMAPARGGRVYKERLKGRLCHRHVLMPEGPKYDSAGRTYVPAHSSRRSTWKHGGRGYDRRDYASTRPPLLLLPRCCNCCKKSVLGCQ